MSVLFNSSARSLRFGRRCEKSMLTRTKPFLLLIVSKNPNIYKFFPKENVFLFAIYWNYNMKLGAKKVLCFVTPKNCLRQHNLRNYEKGTLF